MTAAEIADVCKNTRRECRDWLAHEHHAAVRRTTPADMQQLIDCGVPARAIALARPARVRISVGGRNGQYYQLAEDGTAAWIVPVTTVDHSDPYMVECVDPEKIICAGRCVDLVAFS